MLELTRVPVAGCCTLGALLLWGSSQWGGLQGFLVSCGTWARAPAVVVAEGLLPEALTAGLSGELSPSVGRCALFPWSWAGHPWAGLEVALAGLP